MAVTWNRGAEKSSQLVADRNLYLDKDGSAVVEEGDAASASQLVAKGHVINQADADRLGLVFKNGKVQQDRGVKLGEYKTLVKDLDAERTALYAEIDTYRRENATKDIPNTMEAARVELETRYEHALLGLNQHIKAGQGKDPLRGESQATSLRPEKSDTAREATDKARSAVRSSPTPYELAANAPSAPSEVSPQHPDTSSSVATRADAVPSDNSGAASPRAGKPDAVGEGQPAAKKSAKKSARTRSAKKASEKSE